MLTCGHAHRKELLTVKSQVRWESEVGRYGVRVRSVRQLFFMFTGLVFARFVHRFWSRSGLFVTKYNEET